MKLDLAKHVLQIDGVAVGALIGELRDAREEETPAKRGPESRARRGRDGGASVTAGATVQESDYA